MHKVEVLAPYKLEKANPTDVGYDLKYWEDTPLILPHGKRVIVPTQCRIKAHPGHDYDEVWDIQLRGRSSMAASGIITHVGTIDETYHNEIKVILWYFGDFEQYVISKGDKIAQLVFSRAKVVKTVPAVSITENRDGFGSSGK